MDTISFGKNGLALTQGIHGYSNWLVPSCVRHFKNSVKRFGIAYVHLAAFCMERGYCLYGMVPKLHVFMHFRADFDDSLWERRPHTLNPAVLGNSMSEDFIEKWHANLTCRIQKHREDYHQCLSGSGKDCH